MISNIKKVIAINYASIRSMDVTNGEGVGVALFVQGCHFHCYNCFNQETWDFNGGKEWTSKIEQQFIKLIDRSYINRISILGGEPLSHENISSVLQLVQKIRLLFPDKSIWLYSGYTLDKCYSDFIRGTSIESKQRIEIIKNIDIMVDGQYDDSLKNLSLRFKGSSNQRVIDIQQTIKNEKIVLWTNS